MNRKKRYFIPSVDRQLGNRYELIEALGDGSYGWVWKAQRLDDSAIVAVKIPKAQSGKNSELAEGEYLINQPSHPNVISVYWMGRVPPEREWYAIEMEYFPSHTLARLFDEGKQGFVSSYSKILGIYEQVITGVNYLHSLGMSHGDIKPQNILISGDQAKLTDFGCSLLPEEIYSRTRENGGTILYSAPEFAGTTHREKDAQQIFKGDIYSLGVLLYHLLTSRLPHDTLSQVIRDTPFPKPREINQTIAPQVEDWSSLTIKLLEAEDYLQAEAAARNEFTRSQDAYAFFLMLSATFRDQRYFDCLRHLEDHPDVLTGDSRIHRDLRHLGLDIYLQTRQLEKAAILIQQCLQEEQDSPQLWLKQAAILGTQAKFSEAIEILIRLNREYPKRPAILKKLVLAFEQQRDISKAIAFLRSYNNLFPEDPWASEKIAFYRHLGV
ncbi:MAG: protein kinase [Oculatellaceae cyanobacterium Prado106]|nr:protein kinase [Oculatellaceae cyanobacterium Prado106]